MHIILSKELQKDKKSNAPNRYYKRMPIVIKKATSPVTLILDHHLIPQNINCGGKLSQQRTGERLSVMELQWCVHLAGHEAPLTLR